MSDVRGRGPRRRGHLEVLPSVRDQVEDTLDGPVQTVEEPPAEIEGLIGSGSRTSIELLSEDYGQFEEWRRQSEALEHDGPRDGQEDMLGLVASSGIRSSPEAGTHAAERDGASSQGAMSADEILAASERSTRGGRGAQSTDEDFFDALPLAGGPTNTPATHRPPRGSAALQGASRRQPADRRLRTAWHRRIAMPLLVVVVLGATAAGLLLGSGARKPGSAASSTAVASRLETVAPALGHVLSAVSTSRVVRTDLHRPKPASDHHRGQTRRRVRRTGVRTATRSAAPAPATQQASTPAAPAASSYPTTSRNEVTQPDVAPPASSSAASSSPAFGQDGSLGLGHSKGSS